MKRGTVAERQGLRQRQRGEIKTKIEIEKRGSGQPLAFSYQQEIFSFVLAEC